MQLESSGPAFGALTLTIVLVVSRPRVGRFGRLNPVFGALPALVIMLVAGVLAPVDFTRGATMLWRPLVTIACIMSTTAVAHRLGIFDRVTRIIEIRTRGHVAHAFTAVYVISALTAAVFNNDAAILLLTPIVVPLIRRLYPRRPHLVAPFSFAVFASAGIAPLCTSNPMNLVVAEHAGMRFNAYAVRMVPVALAGSIASYLMLRIAFRKQLDDSIPARGPEIGSLAPMEPTPLGVLAVVGGVFVAYPILSYFDGPVWVAAAAGALIVCALGLRDGAVTPRQIAQGVAWDVLAFLFCIFVTALGLENVGITGQIAALYSTLEDHPGRQLGLIGAFSALGSALLNNHPMAALNALVMATLPGDARWRTLAALVGGDLGPRLLPMGSLAGLLWMEMTRRLGVEIQTKDFIRVGMLATIPALAASLFVLWAEAVLTSSL